jgi:hypothetical protein
VVVYRGREREEEICSGPLDFVNEDRPKVGAGVQFPQSHARRRKRMRAWLLVVGALTSLACASWATDVAHRRQPTYSTELLRDHSAQEIFADEALLPMRLAAGGPGFMIGLARLQPSLRGHGRSTDLTLSRRSHMLKTFSLPMPSSTIWHSHSFGGYRLASIPERMRKIRWCNYLILPGSMTYALNRRCTSLGT